MMDLDEYESEAYKTAVYPGKHTLAGVNYCTLGLTGEAGEIANKLKKVHRDGGGFLTNDRRKELLSELGDVLWYVAMLAVELESSLAEVATNNIMKLNSRAVSGTLQGSGDDR